MSPELHCPRCAHRPHPPHSCGARYHVTFEAGEPGDPCLCPEAALPPPAAPDATGVRMAAGRALLEDMQNVIDWLPSLLVSRPDPRNITVGLIREQLREVIKAHSPAIEAEAAAYRQREAGE